MFVSIWKKTNTDSLRNTGANNEGNLRRGVQSSRTSPELFHFSPFSSSTVRRAHSTHNSTPLPLSDEIAAAAAAAPRIIKFDGGEFTGTAISHMMRPRNKLPA